MTKFISIFIFLFVLIEPCSAQDFTISNLEEARNLSAKVAKDFSLNKISDAVSKLAPYWPLPINELEAFEDKTRKYMNLYEERFGLPIGYVKLREKKMLDFALQETYIVRYNKTAIRLIFVYYKNDDGWLINTFKWDDSFANEFESE